MHGVSDEQNYVSIIIYTYNYIYTLHFKYNVYNYGNKMVTPMT